jgi:pyruvate dehydrogenase E2 component (dihydrolipoamide acetyltransferase)
MVPVIENAHEMDLREISLRAKYLIRQCELLNRARNDHDKGTFTVTNLGYWGVGEFTPILDIPQVAILGAGGIDVRPVVVDHEVQFKQHIALSLTVNHQAVDGAKAAEFLKMLSEYIADFEVEEK